MKSKYVILSIIDLIVWYLFAFYVVYLLQDASMVNPWWAAFVLLVLGVVGTILCPWLENTPGWKKLMGGK